MFNFTKDLFFTFSYGAIDHATKNQPSKLIDILSVRFRSVGRQTLSTKNALALSSKEIEIPFLFNLS